MDALPVVITKHNDEPFFRGAGERVLGRWVASRAAHVIAISEAVRRYMAGPALGVDAGRLSTIDYGIDAAPFAAVPKADVKRGSATSGGSQRTRSRSGSSGAWWTRKISTRCFPPSPYSRCAAARSGLIIVGEGPLEARLRQRARDLAIADRVIWAGFREDIAAVMSAFDIFALTSVHEGLGLVLLEAMAAGKPVVATRVSAIPEVVAENETGLLAGAREPQAVAAAFEQLRDSELRVRFGEAGRRRVRREFTLARMCRATDELYARSVRARFSTGEHEDDVASSPTSLVS